MRQEFLPSIVPTKVSSPRTGVVFRAFTFVDQFCTTGPEGLQYTHLPGYVAASVRSYFGCILRPKLNLCMVNRYISRRIFPADRRNRRGRGNADKHTHLPTSYCSRDRAGKKAWSNGWRHGQERARRRWAGDFGEPVSCKTPIHTVQMDGYSI